MRLDHREVYEHIDRECSFPSTRETVVDRIGAARIAAPNGEDVTVRTLLERSGQPRYESRRELHTTVLANLGEAHIGRKYYDDRSSNPARDDELSL